MTVIVLEAAKYLCNKSDWQYSNLELQKLIYIAQVLHVGENSQPLVYGDFQAWKYGPVHPDLYRYLRLFGAFAIPKTYSVFEGISDVPEESVKNCLQDVSSAFAPSDSIGPLLMELTHREKGAWKRHYKLNRNEIIPISSIKDEYHALYVNN